ncbi:hypothetical protein C1Y08_29230 [Pseudomonas sp. FW306-02-F02-AA]|uniref:Uncharacterized protein n=1 Tax=Pseudomonas fluorescens TaxID=294 RepID=A0A0N9VYH4_PSEFL|nr:hypothetical protein AO353_22320 [Pseudomonas fluorescens]PMZ00666.1 hypothetical protein C1Y07_29240 [Pseudomonas sp. FW306-02-F02-AB]PMZ06541.1 hypothetical protein C1Y06_29340 [Pseudomonas sp. FW306-02-H06C]PMZ12417.1 hypothetical protein C1Y08_29230 [Pseudomonas sp. FW306-02-F02-AA]PMZ19446.1 hypothetical protein C1Y09_24220 [Pseudomonas sp. FW306-02-F08-AA]PMZ24257.1 hypothetical protein C1Y05_29810 [Pseudomonas sp. FW306-02-F04-BA]PMZ30832.1 hypothetical protein C1X99_29510 [Pseudomo
MELTLIYIALMPLLISLLFLYLALWRWRSLKRLGVWTITKVFWSTSYYPFKSPLISCVQCF